MMETNTRLFVNNVANNLVFDYSDDEQYILTQLLKEKDYYYVEELKSSIKGKTLAPFQTNLVAYSLINKKCIISADTGLGKTYIAGALINVIKSKCYNMKWIWIGPNFVGNQSKLKLEDISYDLNIKKFSATQEDVWRLENTPSEDWDILILSYEAIAHVKVQNYLLRYSSLLKGLIVDESQLLANLSGTASRLIQSMIVQMQYAYFLTATPIRISVSQFINQVFMLKGNIFGEEIGRVINHFTKKDENGKVVGVRNVRDLKDICWGSYISITRKQLNIKGEYRVSTHIVDENERYSDIKRGDIFKHTVRDLDNNKTRQLLELVHLRTTQGMQGLIYVNLNANKEPLKDLLNRSGIRCDILDGYITNTDKKKQIVTTKFNKKELDVVITNRTVGLDLECQYIIFPEMTFDYKQVIGRGERGLKAVNLQIDFILVKDSEEIPYFIENVWERAQVLGLTCDKDISELNQAYRNVRDQQLFDDNKKESKYTAKQEW